jgi:hypothetical protein
MIVAYFEVLTQVFVWKNWVNPWTTSERTASLRAQNGSELLPKMKHECHTLDPLDHDIRIFNRLLLSVRFPRISY